MNAFLAAFRTMLLIIVALAFAGCAVTIVPPTATVGGTLYQPQKSCRVDSDTRGSSSNTSSRTSVRDTETCNWIDQRNRSCESVTTYTTTFRTEKDKNGKTFQVPERRSSTNTSCRNP